MFFHAIYYTLFACWALLTFSASQALSVQNYIDQTDIGYSNIGFIKSSVFAIER